jgi:hypothetical protein
VSWFWNVRCEFSFLLAWIYLFIARNEMVWLLLLIYLSPILKKHHILLCFLCTCKWLVYCFRWFVVHILCLSDLHGQFACKAIQLNITGSYVFVECCNFVCICFVFMNICRIISLWMSVTVVCF